MPARLGLRGRPSPWHPFPAVSSRQPRQHQPRGCRVTYWTAANALTILMAVLEAFSETGEIKGLLTMNSYRELDRWERGEHVGGMTDELAQNLTLGKPGVG